MSTTARKLSPLSFKKSTSSSTSSSSGSYTTSSSSSSESSSSEEVVKKKISKRPNLTPIKIAATPRPKMLDLSGFRNGKVEVLQFPERQSIWIEEDLRQIMTVRTRQRNDRPLTPVPVVYGEDVPVVEYDIMSVIHDEQRRLEFAKGFEKRKPEITRFLAQEHILEEMIGYLLGNFNFGDEYLDCRDEMMLNLAYFSEWTICYPDVTRIRHHITTSKNLMKKLFGPVFSDEKNDFIISNKSWYGAVKFLVCDSMSSQFLDFMRTLYDEENVNILDYIMSKLSDTHIHNLVIQMFNPELIDCLIRYFLDDPFQISKYLCISLMNLYQKEETYMTTVAISNSCEIFGLLLKDRDVCDQVVQDTDFIQETITYCFKTTENTIAINLMSLLIELSLYVNDFTIFSTLLTADHYRSIRYNIYNKKVQSSKKISTLNFVNEILNRDDKHVKRAITKYKIAKNVIHMLFVPGTLKSSSIFQRSAIEFIRTLLSVFPDDVMLHILEESRLLRKISNALSESNTDIIYTSCKILELFKPIESIQNIFETDKYWTKIINNPSFIQYESVRHSL